MKNSILLIVLTFVIFGNVFGQEKNAIKRGIVNGKAVSLPKPNYPQEAKDFCASGLVEVEVLIGQDGNVIEAKAISGDELLHASAVEAAKLAKFTTGHLAVKVKGILIYNFVSERKCIVIGIVNKKARSIPKPKVANLNKPKHLQIKQDEVVEVQIIIEVWSGKVLRARAISGHPMLRAACENSARQAKFSPVNDVPLNIPIKAILVYKFKPNGKIEF